jgi:hypothetical protein
MKNNGQGNKLKKKDFNCGKEIHGQGKNIGQGNLHNGLIYTSPTKDRPWTGIPFTSPYIIKEQAFWGGAYSCPNESTL